VDPLVQPSAVTPFLEGMITPPDEWMALEAIEVASAMVRSYCRSSITHVAGDVAVLQGSHGRRLVLGERPVTAVTAVALDGTLLDPSDFRWQRSGALWRDAGWGGPSHEVEVEYDHGYAVVPADLAAVTRLAAVRLCSNPEQLAREEVEGYSVLVATPAGFTVGERLILDRYRRKTWP
jgi:hypothetical protein